MSRAARKGGVQAEPPATEAVVSVPAEPASAEVPALGAGWKVALAVWLLAFVGLGAFEVMGTLYKLLFR